MPRVTRGNKRLKRKKILRRAKGYYLAKSKLYRIAREQVQRSLSLRLPRPPTDASDSFAGCGSCASMPPHGFTTSRTRA